MELELQPEFHGFQDRLTTFELSRGKKTGDPDYDEKNYCGKFKVTYLSLLFFHLSLYTPQSHFLLLSSTKTLPHGHSHLSGVCFFFKIYSKTSAGVKHLANSQTKIFYEFTSHTPVLMYIS